MLGGKIIVQQAERSSPAVSHVTSVMNDNIDVCYAVASITMYERDCLCCPFGVLQLVESLILRPGNIFQEKTKKHNTLAQAQLITQASLY